MDPFCITESKSLLFLLHILCHILVGTEITEGPVDVELSEEFMEENTEIIFHCKASSDDATPVTVNW